MYICKKESMIKLICKHFWSKVKILKGKNELKLEISRGIRGKVQNQKNIHGMGNGYAAHHFTV